MRVTTSMRGNGTRMKTGRGRTTGGGEKFQVFEGSLATETRRCLEDDPFHAFFEETGVEVEQQAEMEAGNFEIGKNLRFEDRVVALNALEFQVREFSTIRSARNSPIARPL
jgi:hypothetical protein